MKTIRVLVTVREEINPALFAELEKIPDRLRAERLRVLATMALSTLGNPPTAAHPGQTVDEKKIEHEKKIERVTRLAKSLMERI